MINHYITRYTENGKLYVESWLQINIFGRAYCFSRKRVEVVMLQDKEIEEEKPAE